MYWINKLNFVLPFWYGLFVRAMRSLYWLVTSTSTIHTNTKCTKSALLCNWQPQQKGALFRLGLSAMSNSHILHCCCIACQYISDSTNEISTHVHNIIYCFASASASASLNDVQPLSGERCIFGYAQPNCHRSIEFQSIRCYQCVS